MNLDEPESLKIYPGSIKIAQKPYIIGSLGPKALTDQSFEGKGEGLRVSGFKAQGL